MDIQLGDNGTGEVEVDVEDAGMHINSSCMW